MAHEVSTHVEKSCSKTAHKLFSDEVGIATALEKFTTSILMYRQIMFHDVAPLCGISTTCSVLLLRNEKFIFEYGRDFLTTLPLHAVKRALRHSNILD